MISIIIPTLNEEAALGTTLKALTTGLRCTPYEILVSDGGSTDRTALIAAEYGALVVTEETKRKQTIGRGRNLAAWKAKGAYLVFMDADVQLPEPDAFFAEALRLFQCDPRLVGLTVLFRVIPERETAADRFFFGFVNLTHTLMNNVLRLGSASGGFQMVKASVFHEIGGYREELAVVEDNELFSRLAKKGRTRIHHGLTAYESGRRAHKVGWPRLLASWTINSLWVLVLKRSYHTEWSQIRSEKDHHAQS